MYRVELKVIQTREIRGKLYEFLMYRVELKEFFDGGDGGKL